MPNLMTPFGVTELLDSSDGKSLFRGVRDATATSSSAISAPFEISTSKEVNSKKGEVRQLTKVTWQYASTVDGAAVLKSQSLHFVRTYKMETTVSDVSARDNPDDMARAVSTLVMALLNPAPTTGIMAPNLTRLDAGMVPLFSSAVSVPQVLDLNFDINP